MTLINILPKHYLLILHVELTLWRVCVTTVAMYIQQYIPAVCCVTTVAMHTQQYIHAVCCVTTVAMYTQQYIPAVCCVTTVAMYTQPYLLLAVDIHVTVQRCHGNTTIGSLHAFVEIQNILYYCKQYKHTSQYKVFL
jgi:hypothetical protein